MAYLEMISFYIRKQEPNATCTTDGMSMGICSHDFVQIVFDRNFDGPIIQVVSLFRALIPSPRVIYVSPREV